ncbi:MAG: DUF805 domain-containing protein [Patescibacteria group bacterium]
MNQKNTIFKLLFSFAGRVSRAEFVKGNLIVLLILLFLGGLFAFFGPKIDSENFIPQFTMFALAILIFALITTTALGVKRSHDLDWSGWLALLMFLPMIGFVYSLLLFFKIGTVGPNRFGLDSAQK